MLKNLPETLAGSLQIRWEAFCQALQKTDSLENVPENILELLQKAFLFSEFVSKTLTRRPNILFDLLKNNDLCRSYPANEYTQKLSLLLKKISEENSLSTQLHLFRYREMIRIAFRDLAGLADLFETMADLSLLAEACVEQTFAALYTWMVEKFGTPCSPDGRKQKIVVLGLGKLGAGELNFSSDIDLVFTFPKAGVTDNNNDSIPNEVFFSRLTRSFLKIFSESTPSGLLFRVDLRLRPYGENGPIVLSFNSMEEYYEAQGREWERYALIKARVVAGDRKAGRELLSRLNPFIYRRYLDYSSFESLRDMKKSINFEVRRKGLQDNIKLGAGGIREIEFFGQVFQLIRGGVEVKLQEPSIVKVLRILAKEGYIQQAICDELINAYVFLRNTEHRLQEFDDRQTHTLPKDSIEIFRLALSMGFEKSDAFLTQLKLHMDTVHRHFNQVLSSETTKSNDHENQFETVWGNPIDSKEAERILRASGFDRPDEIIRQLNLLQHDPTTRSLSREGRRRLNKLIPRVIETTAKSKNPLLSFTRIIELIKTVEQRTNYISLLLENPSVLTQLINLSLVSPWIISFLTRHPVLLDELLDARLLYSPPSRDQLSEELQKKLLQVTPNDLEQQIELLCIFKQINTLRVAAADITASYPLMRVSDHLSDIAELILEKILNFSHTHLAMKYGAPKCYLEKVDCKKGFAIIAYGKLGGIELGYGSDLDLVFLHAAMEGDTQGGSSPPIANSQFFTRLGQRIIHTLTTHTRAGKLYEIDMRLRPSGSSGPLVSHMKTFMEYQKEKAWTFEHQAVVRARPICGDPAITRRFEEIRKTVLTIPRDQSKLLQDILDMRDKMRRNHLDERPETFNLKQGFGGIVDIEFLVQYLILANAFHHPDLVTWSDNVRQLEALSDSGIIEREAALFLKEAYLTFRSRVHRLNLQNKPSITPEKEFLELGRKVTEIWTQYLS
ncbi:MAG: bifunctional [glutamate--ammonia ligase]-adenylyl-L-tyrosine phosphorylase/[glutamate--ammonia-ligase] adenylyltransferase [Desulfobacterales bacterium]